MKFRLTLTFLSLFLALAVSADRPSTPCSGCWLASNDAPTIDQSFGVNIHFTDPQPGEIKMIAAAGFRWVRMDFKWELTEPERGRYDFSVYDRLMQALDQSGIRAMFILDYGNPLYGEGAPRTERARQAFADWAAAAARHFAGRGVMWEVYNEPNQAVFWARPNPAEYAELVGAVGRAFRSRAPDEKLIGPAVSEMDFSFLDSCFKSGALDLWSAVSVHPYRRGNPENAAVDYAKLRAMIAGYRSRNANDKSGQTASNIPIISGEWGYSSVWPDMNEDKQANMLARQFLTNAANGIPLSIWYDWRDDGTGPREPEHHFGLVNNQYRPGESNIFQPKPAYLAAQTLIRTLAGYRFQQRLSLGSNDDYVLVFAKDGQPVIAAWTTSPNLHPIAIQFADGEFTVTKVTGEEAGRLSPVNGKLSVKLSSAPVYIARVR